MECPICTFEFDSEKRKPKLCRCGNSICEECVLLIVSRNQNTFICPLCKFHLNDYRKNTLTPNNALQALMMDLDALKNPIKDKSTLTEALICKTQEIQANESMAIGEFNEYVTVFGIIAMLVLFMPWVMKK
jgi:rubredoxin